MVIGFSQKRGPLFPSFAKTAVYEDRGLEREGVSNVEAFVSLGDFAAV